MMSTATTDREIVTSRVFEAPRELVWRAWTGPSEIEKWWGPYGFTTTTQEFNLYPEGVWRFIMHGPDVADDKAGEERFGSSRQRDYKNKIIFLEVKPPERLVYRHADEEETEDVQFHVTVTFEELGTDKTELTMRAVFESPEERDRVAQTYGAIEGAKQTLERLAQHLAKM